jgi:YHS domain-containing protein
MKLAATLSGLCALLAVIALIMAPPQLWAESTINTNWRDLAVKGYDPVAYFTLGRPVEGKKEFEYKWKDSKWRFSSEAHLNLFKSNPEKYAPQYGGYWAYAVAMGTTADIDPVEGWKIVDGKLYLNNSREVQKKWERDIPGYIRKADENWPGVLDWNEQTN